METNTNPDIQWALDLFAPDPLHEENLIVKISSYALLPLLAVTGVSFSNWMLRRPIYSSLHRYGLGLAIGLVASKIVKDKKLHREIERDNVLVQYIKLHPEDFPPPERKTYNEIFEEWIPCR